ncbi:DALR anticodon-binding domain-containing protein [Ruania alba]|uniref:DALR anticodon binding domain-containing protein n=1 Tax=Ruania alba TaxID=648782 RepID=A0A1H5NDU2_9MICO|nr:DALR anticodon-binding domain-containing protein [Ruania alba]SEE99706.1 DALR anticodon binding domain-containing protein [Ruania alba]
MWPDDLAAAIARVLAIPAGAPVPLRAGTHASADWHTDAARTLIRWLDPEAAADPDTVDAWQNATARRLADGLDSHDDVVRAWADGATVRVALTSTCLLRVVPAVLSEWPDTPRRTGERRADADALSDVRFAHARARNVSRIARAHRVAPAVLPGVATELETPDRRLLVALAGSRSALRVGTVRAVHAHARALTSAYHLWYASTRTAPRAADEITSIHRTRLALNDAVAVALATELTAVGLDAPEHL